MSQKSGIKDAITEVDILIVEAHTAIDKLELKRKRLVLQLSKEKKK